MKALLVISAALASLTHVASGAPTSVQLNSIAFTAGCTSVGCGGEFKGMIGGNAVGGQLKNGTTVELFCIDYQNDVFIPGAIYQANLSTITTGSDLSNTRYGRTT